MKTTVTCPQGGSVVVDCDCPDVTTTQTDDAPNNTTSKQQTKRAKRHIPRTMIEDWTNSWLNDEATFLALGKRDNFTAASVGYNVYKHVAVTSISAMRELVLKVKDLEGDVSTLEDENEELEGSVQELHDDLAECTRAREAGEKEIRDLKVKLDIFADGVKELHSRNQELQDQLDHARGGCSANEDDPVDTRDYGDVVRSYN